MFKRKIVVKDYQKLLKKLWLYKCFLFRNVEFESCDEKSDFIVKALNIKKRRERIEYVYDIACQQIDEHFKNENCCGFEKGKCFVQRKKTCAYTNGCCRKCRHQSDVGCLTKNLTCKMFFCSEVTKRYKVPEWRDLTILKLLSWRQRIILRHDYFSTKEEILSDLWIGSITIFAARLFFRCLFKSIIWNK